MTCLYSESTLVLIYSVAWHVEPQEGVSCSGTICAVTICYTPRESGFWKFGFYFSAVRQQKENLHPTFLQAVLILHTSSICCLLCVVQMPSIVHMEERGSNNSFRTPNGTQKSGTPKQLAEDREGNKRDIQMHSTAIQGMEGSWGNFLRSREDSDSSFVFWIT